MKITKISGIAYGGFSVSQTSQKRSPKSSLARKTRAAAAQSRGRFRKEKDALGEILVPQDKLYGAQTQRSLENFPIGSDRMPFALIAAIALVKESAATAHRKLSLMSASQSRYIIKAAQEIREGRLNEHFPLSVWQTGSGTQTNMNVNEVIARRAGQLSQGMAFHPNDDVNRSQSSNDVFPSAMRIAAFLEAKKKTLAPDRAF